MQRDKQSEYLICMCFLFGMTSEIRLLTEHKEDVLKITIFWDITPCNSLKVNRRFGGTYRLHLQEDSTVHNLN
jgi:hypothetical protein